MFQPINKTVLVKLDTSPYKTIATEQAEFDSANKGLVVHHGDYPELEDKRIIWEQFKEKEAMFSEDGVDYALVEYEKIRGIDE